MIEENTAGKREGDQKRGRREKSKITYDITLYGQLKTGPVHQLRV